ncbi:MAG: hypothetical protein AB7N54_04345 [Alphaproteobacteria bacterium]
MTAKVMGALPGAAVDVLTADPSLLPLEPDHSLDSYVAERFKRVVRVLPSRLVQALTRLPRLPLRPDRWVLLTRSMVQAAQGMDLGAYDCLVTRSQFHSAHLVGLEIKRSRPNLPWLACFSDPWSGAVYDREVPLATGWSARREVKVLAAADGLVFPTAEMLSFVDGAHPALRIATKGSVVPHGFDAALYGNDSGPPEASPVRIGLFGSFYGPRSPHPLLAGLAELHDRGAPTFSLDVYGPNTTHFASALDDFPSLARLVRHRGMLDHVTALRQMRSYHLLVMVDAPMAPPSIFLPSKLTDYIGAGRPIVAITPAGAAADVVKSVGGFVASPDDPASVAHMLAASVAAAASGQLTTNRPQGEAYAIARVAGTLREVIGETMARRALH